MGTASKFVGEHSPALLTGVGVVGTITTAVLAAQGGAKAAHRLSEESPHLTLQERAKRTWPEFVPAAASGALTVSAIILANRIGNRRTAAIAAAYAISEKAIVEYRDKVREVVGQNKETKIQDAIAQDQVSRTPVPGNLVVVTGKNVLCFDSWSSRYFTSSMEELKSAQNAVNYQLNKYDYASLSDFYDEIRLDHTEESDDIGWNIDSGLLELEFSSCISPDQEPALVIRFNKRPFPGYSNRK